MGDAREALTSDRIMLWEELVARVRASGLGLDAQRKRLPRGTVAD
jgi:hypothetical protein